MTDNHGVAADAAGLSSATPTEPVPVSSVPVSIPNAWRRSFQMDWSTDSGVVTFIYPGDMTHRDIADVRGLLEVAFAGMNRRASVIEARRAETQSGSVHESATAESRDAQPSPASTPTPKG